MSTFLGTVAFLVGLLNDLRLNRALDILYGMRVQNKEEFAVESVVAYTRTNMVRGGFTATSVGIHFVQ